jgi:hypothetical protein
MANSSAALTLMIAEEGNFHWDLEKQTSRIKYVRRT